MGYFNSRKIGVVLLLSTALAGPGFAQVYVSKGGDNTDGMSWATAYSNVSTGVAVGAG